MGYYLRFILTEARPVSLASLQDALQTIDPQYHLRVDSFDDMTGELAFGDNIIGTIELNTADDDIFREDIDDLCDLVIHSTQDNTHTLLDMLENAVAMVAVSARWPDDDPTPTLDKLEALWDWLFTHYGGILQADNDGFYNQDGLILAMNLKI